MAYDYIRRTYGIDVRVGVRVRHTVTNRLGTVGREKKGEGNYVSVKFDRNSFPLPCHPQELEFNPEEGRAHARP
jgi:hypothetical protein